MEYIKQTWIAPEGTGLSRYAKSGETASHVTLTLDPENLTNTPTPFTAERMAHMEDGIAKAYDTAKKWETARNISISDADGTNTGTAVSVDGSENETLKLPATIKANVTGNASTATAPLYLWKKVNTDLHRYVAGESPTTTFYWYKVCKITTAMTFDIEVASDYNHAYSASYRLSVSIFTSGSTMVYTVALLNLGQTVAGQAQLAVAIDADGYLYIQTDAVWACSLHVTLLYSYTSNFSITMDKLGYALFGTESGFTPVKLITQTGAFRWTTSGSLQTNTPVINTNIVGNVTGNAGTATKLATPRKIGSVDFDGSADIEIPIENYSTTEKIIGTWIDGKPLYRKVVNLGALPNSTVKSVPHGISNIGFCKMTATAISSSAITMLPFIPVSNINQGVDIYVNNTTIIITAQLDRSSYTGTAILEYTKTTD